MSQENVDFVLAGFKRFERGEIDPERFDEKARLTAPAGWPEAGPFEGRDAVVKQFRRLAEDYAEHRSVVKTVAAEGQWVVVGFRWETRGATSAIEMAADMAAAFRVQDERYLEAHYRWTAEEALAAAGLGKDG